MSLIIATADRRRDEVAQAVLERTSLWTPIAEQIFTPIDVSSQRGTLRQLKPHQFLASISTLRSPGTSFNRRTMTLNAVAYDCDEDGAEQPLDRAEIAAYANVDFAAASASALFNSLRLRQDAEAYSLCTSATFTGGGATYYLDASATPWSTVGNDIIGHVKSGIDAVYGKTGFAASHMAISSNTYRNMWRNTAIRSSFGTYSPLKIPRIDDVPARQAVAAAVGLRDLAIQNFPGSSDYDKASPTLSSSWTDNYAFVYVKAGAEVSDGAPGETMIQPGVGHMPTWATPDGGGAGYMAVEEYDEPSTRSHIFRVVRHTDMVLTNAAFGFLIKIA